MLKDLIKKLWIIAICVFIFPLCLLGSYSNLAELSITMHSLANRANELGMLIKTVPYKMNSALSDDLNQIISSLETRQVSLAKSGKSKISETINYLLRQFIAQPSYTLENDIISFSYKGFMLKSTISKFSNELLSIAHLADYISSKFNQNDTVRVLSNVFNNPLLYLLLNSMFINEKRKLDLTIIGGISKDDFKKLEKTTKKTLTIHHYDNTLPLNDDKQRRLLIDVYLLNPDIPINNLFNQSICTNQRQNDQTISLFPKEFNNYFLTEIFASVDQNISSRVRENFFEFVKKNTRRGPQILKNQLIEGFACKFKTLGTKNIANIIHRSRNNSNIRLFLFAEHEIISLDFSEDATNDRSGLKDIINIYGAITKTIFNLKIRNPDGPNAPLANNIRFYLYTGKPPKFKKYRSINSIDTQATNLSGKV